MEVKIISCLVLEVLEGACFDLLRSSAMIMMSIWVLVMQFAGKLGTMLSYGEGIYQFLLFNNTLPRFMKKSFIVLENICNAIFLFLRFEV